MLILSDEGMWCLYHTLEISDLEYISLAELLSMV